MEPEDPRRLLVLFQSKSSSSTAVTCQLDLRRPDFCSDWISLIAWTSEEDFSLAFRIVDVEVDLADPLLRLFITDLKLTQITQPLFNGFLTLSSKTEVGQTKHT